MNKYQKFMKQLNLKIKSIFIYLTCAVVLPPCGILYNHLVIFPGLPFFNQLENVEYFEKLLTSNNNVKKLTVAPLH